MNLPKEFNYKNYKLLNEDLFFMNEQQLISHFLNFGLKEKRPYIVDIPSDFDCESYKNLNDDLKYFNDLQLISHYINHGKSENREYKLNLPVDFNVHNYKKLNHDLYHLNDFELMVHYHKFGKNQNRSYLNNESNFKCENIENNLKFIKNHSNNSYNIYGANKSNEHLFNLLKNVYLCVNDKNNYWSDFDKFVFSGNSFHNFLDNIENNILFFEDLLYKEQEYFIIINHQYVSKNYLYNNTIPFFEIFEKNYFDIIELSSIDSYESLYCKIKKNNFEIEKSKFINLDSYLISKKSIKKIISNHKNNDNLLKNIDIGTLNKNYLKYEQKDSYSNDNEKIFYETSISLWDAYFRVTSFCNKTYCINLGFDIKKRQNMELYSNLLNKKEDDFFHDGVLGINIPKLNTLINMGIYDSSIINNFDIKTGTLGLSIAQTNLFKDAIKNNYDYIMILEDDISFPPNYFETIDIFLNKYQDFDICYLGLSTYEKNIEDFLTCIDNIYNTKIYTNKNLCQKIGICGMFAIILSKKSINTFYNRFSPINNVSDILLNDVAFDVKKDFSDNSFTKTFNNLKSYYFVNDLFCVERFISGGLTEENDFNCCNNFKQNKVFNFLSKLKKIHFKIDNDYPIKIFCHPNSNNYSSIVLQIIKEIIPNHKICFYYDNNIDISIFSSNHNILDECINLIINNPENIIFNEFDIGITKNNDDNIYCYNINITNEIEKNSLIDFLTINIKKAFGLLSRKIFISNNIHSKSSLSYDIQINNFQIPNFVDNKKKLSRYISDYTNKNDIILIPSDNKIISNTKFYFINLDSRKDRLINVLNEFKKIDIHNFERFSAIKPTLDEANNCKFMNKDLLWKKEDNYIIGAVGCKSSHYECLKKSFINDSSYKYICIVEDDIVFENDVLNVLENSLEQIENDNIDFDILFLTSNLGNKEDAIKVKKNLLRLNKGLTTTAQLFKYEKIPHIIHTIENSSLEIDNVYQDLLNEKYCLYPMSCYQKNFFSDINSSAVDYGCYHKKFNYD